MVNLYRDGGISMKRKSTVIAAIALATTMMVTPVFAYDAVEIDMDELREMNTEDLISMRDAINSVIAEKGGDNIIGSGVYEVGTDIKAANFKLTCIKGGSSVYVTLYENKEAENSGDSILYQGIRNDENTGTSEAVNLNLKDGEILSIDGTAIIEDASGSFWAPDSEESKVE